MVKIEYIEGSLRCVLVRLADLTSYEMANLADPTEPPFIELHQAPNNTQYEDLIAQARGIEP